MTRVLADCVLGILVKQPLPGQVKTRLAAQTSAEWAARLAEAFLLDTIARFRALPVRRVLAFSPAEASGYFADLGRGEYHLWPQVEGDLGRRMHAFFAAHLPSDTSRAVLIGADSPTLPAALVEQAFVLLESAEVVLGPAMDGGYYLIGCRGAVPPVFSGPAWGGPLVLSQTLAQLPESTRLAVLPPWYDVDALPECVMLRGHVAAIRRAGIEPGIPATEQLITSPFPFNISGA